MMPSVRLRHPRISVLIAKRVAAPVDANIKCATGPGKPANRVGSPAHNRTPSPNTRTGPALLAPTRALRTRASRVRRCSYATVSLKKCLGERGDHHQFIAARLI